MWVKMCVWVAVTHPEHTHETWRDDVTKKVPLGALA